MYFKLLFSSLIVATLFTQCNNSGSAGEASFCDTTCQTDSIKFNRDDINKKPYVYITMDQCIPDTIFWSHTGLSKNLAMPFADLVAYGLKINKTHTEAHIIGTDHAWLELNDCETGRGYLIKLPYEKENSISKYSSALTRFDKKFAVADGLICYADYSFVYVEDMATGKTEKLLMGDAELKIDWKDLHATFDSVNVSRSRIFVTLNEYGKKRTLEKAISL
jgi:hypothetical protein